MLWRIAAGAVLVAFTLVPAPLVRAQGSTTVSGTIPLDISGIAASAITTTTTTISWTTNGDATSRVFYDTTSHTDVSGYAFSTGEDPAPVISHSASLSALTAATTYHYRVKSTTPDSLSAVSEDATFMTTSAGGGGGGGGSGGFGGGGGGGGGLSGPGVTNLAPYTNNDGLFSLATTAASEDGKVKLSIARGVLAKAKDGGALKSINILPLADPPEAPSGSQMIGLAYEIGPAGASFKPAITLTFSFDPDKLPAGFDKKRLMLVTWDAAANSWVDLEAIVDAASNTVSITISRLGIFTLVAQMRPASFSVGDLIISPAEVQTGGRVSIGASVRNTGDIGGTYAIELTVNGKIESSQGVTIAGNGAQVVSFSVVRDTPGRYEVSLGGLSGAFTVRIPPAPAAFSLSPLAISRSEIHFGEETSISVVVENTGDLAGTYSVSFRIDGAVVGVREVTVAGHATQQVSLDVPGKSAGTFSVDVNGRAGSFTVKPWAGPPPKAQEMNWWLVGGIIAALISGASWSWLAQRQRAL